MGFWLGPAARLLAWLQMAGVSVTGVIRDGDNGSPLPGAVVVVADATQRTVTDDQGGYTLPGVPPGAHRVMVRRIGYAPQTFEALVPPGGALEVDVALHREPILLEAVDVEARVAVRGLTAGDGSTYPNRGLDIAAVRNHPLSSEPDVLQAASGGDVVLLPESPSGVSVLGGSSDQIVYLVDDVPVFSPYHTAGTFSAWNPDALARLDVLVSATPLASASGLSGIIAATTRDPGSHAGMQGSFSTTQARQTFSGPMGSSGAGYLVSLRSTFPGLLFHPNEASYLSGRAYDWLAKVEEPVGGGRLRVLGFGLESQIGTLARSTEPVEIQPFDPSRNAFAWESQSFGAAWTRDLDRGSLEVRAWSAMGDNEATWLAADSTGEHLESELRDEGLTTLITRSGENARTSGGLRLQRTHTSYVLQPDSTAGRSFVESAETPTLAMFLEHDRALGARTKVGFGLTSTLGLGELYLSPGLELRWRASSALSFSGGVARRHQFAQSLRNPESVVGNVFPADLYLAASSGGVPVARSDNGFIACELHPSDRLRCGVLVYTRKLSGVALVAPVVDDPFATSGFMDGSGRARGIAVEASANTSRIGIVASYGFQHVRLDDESTAYVPSTAAAHVISGGITAHATRTLDVRLGVESSLGRRATALAGSFEWEGCQLLDQGCEFGGSPDGRSGSLGGTRLPDYLRLDLGVRKQWRLRLGGRDGRLALFGTVTNLLDRRNVMTYATDPVTGQRSAVEMRPRAPLVAGVDWTF